MSAMGWARENWWVLGILLGELAAGAMLIQFRGCTEIDWCAYMEQIAGVVGGDLDYLNLKGPTGPLVYPAGFVYIYTVLYYVTEMGTNTNTAMYISLCVYLVNLVFVFGIYKSIKEHTGGLAVVLCCMSYRIHSVSILRLFNDPVPVLFLNICIYFMIRNKWNTAILFYAIAFSIKMSILLYLPGLLLVLLWASNYRKVIRTVLFLVLFQGVLGAPFLYTNARGYLSRAFDFGRTFGQITSVNWFFLPETVFDSHAFHILLLVLHLALLLVFLVWKCAYGPTLKQKLRSLNFPTSLRELRNPPLDIKHIDPLGNSYSVTVYVMFSVNAIGMAFARSIHHQFYSWYFYSLPFFVCYGGLSVVKVLLLIAFEFSYFTCPPTSISSAVLLLAHISLLIRIGFLMSKATPIDYIRVVDKED